MQNKNIIITGGSSGLGQAISNIFLKNNCRIVITSRNQEKINSYKKIIPKQYINNIYFLKTELEKEKDIDNLLQYSQKLFDGKIDCIINNASISLTGKFRDIPFDIYKKALNLNFILISYQIKKLLGNNNSKKIKIVNILGGSVHIGIPYSSSYSLTKLTLKVFSEIIQMEKANLDVILFHPGPLNTGFENRKLFGFKKNPIKSLKSRDAKIIAEKFYKDLCRGKKFINYSKFQNILLLIYIFFPKLISRLFK